jgi:hypothetical protein
MSWETLGTRNDPTAPAFSGRLGPNAVVVAGAGDTSRVPAWLRPDGRELARVRSRARGPLPTRLGEPCEQIGTQVSATLENWTVMTFEK